MEVRSIEAIIRALNDKEIQYLVVGGLAVNAHGYVRLTRDVDLVFRLDPDNARRGLAAILQLGYQMAIPAPPEDFADPKIREYWRLEKNMVVLKLWSDEHRRTPVDIFIYEPFDVAVELRQSSAMEVASGLAAPVVSLPTLLHMKQTAGRPQDLLDIVELQRIK